MKIGYLVPEFPGQTHAFFWRERRELLKLGFEVTLLSTRRPRRGRAAHPWATEAAGQTHYLSRLAVRYAATPAAWRLTRDLRAEGFGLRSAWETAASAVGLARLADAVGFEHVHVHSCARAADVAWAARKLSGLTYSLTLHSEIKHYGGGQARKWGDARFGIAVTDVMRRAAMNAVGRSGTPVGVAPMGVDLGVFTRGGSYAPWVGSGPLRLVTCGRLNPGKGHDDCIRVVRRLRRDGIPGELTIVGGSDGKHDDYAGELSALAAELGVADGVRLIGSVGEDRVAAELADAHAFVLGSRNEAIGVATMEAMAMGLPVVVTGCPGVEELVSSAAVGRLVPVNDPSAMAAAVTTLANDPADAVAVGQSARRRVEEKFHAGVSAELLARMLGVEVDRDAAGDDRIVRLEDVVPQTTPGVPLQELANA